MCDLGWQKLLSWFVMIVLLVGTILVPVRVVFMLGGREYHRDDLGISDSMNG